MNLVTVVSPEFLDNAKYLIESFRKFYPDDKAILCYFGGDIKEDYRLKGDIYFIDVPHSCPHAHNPRFYFFKTYALNAAMSFNEPFIYLDSRHIFLKKPVEIEEILKEKDRFFVQYPHEEIFKLKVCTTSRCFKAMDCDLERYKESYCYWAAIQAYNPTDFNKKFIQEMLESMMNPEIAGPSNHIQNPEPDNPDCKYHRNDQSCLSIMIEKYNIHQSFDINISQKFGDIDTLEFVGSKFKLDKNNLIIRGRNSLENINLINATDNPIRVSAIVSTYNSEKFIRGCFEDLINQTIYQKGELEIVVVNSGSQENEDEIIKKYQQQYKNIKYIKTENRETIYQAWNRGIKAACGKYITNANTDDRHRKDALEILANTLDADENTGLVFADQYVTKIENQTFEEHDAVGYFNWPEFDRIQLIHCACCGPQPMWRKSLHDKFGYFDETLKVANDYEWWLRLSDKVQFKHVPEKIGLYFLSDNSVEHRFAEEMRNETLQIRLQYAQNANLRTMDYNKYKSTYLVLENQKQPMVSVIIPTYNRPERLKIAIKSVLNQTFKDFEVLVINDGGESVKNVIQEFNDERIKYIELGKNRGMSVVRNTGIKSSKGKYLNYLDDDDFFYPDHLETLVCFLENSNYKVAYTDAFRASQSLQNGEYVTTDRKVVYSEDFNYPKLLIGNYIPILCVMHKRECLVKSGMYDETLTTHEDWDFWIRIGSYYEFAHIKKATCEFTWRTDGSSMTSSRRADMLRTLRMIYNKTKDIVAGNEEILHHRKINEKSIEIEVNKIQEKEIVGKDAASTLTEKPGVSIIIPVFNKIELTRKCIDSIYSFTHGINFEIIVVDNASNDGIFEYIKEQSTIKKNLSLISNAKNEGFAVACNQGISQSRSEYVVLLNNDTEVTDGWLNALIKEAETDEKIGIVGSLLLYPNSDKIQHCGVRVGELEKSIAPYHIHRLRSLNSTPVARNSRDYKVVTFACVLIKRKVINEIGLFDERYKNGFEDVDYCFRTYTKGYRIRYCADSLVYHYESMTATRHDFDKINQALLDEKWLNKIEIDDNENSTLSNQWEIWCREELEKNTDDIRYLHRLIHMLMRNAEFREAEELKKKMISLLAKQEKRKPSITFIIPYSHDLYNISECIKSIRRTVTNINFNITISGNIPQNVVETDLPRSLVNTDDVYLLNDPMINNNIISLSQGIISNNSCFVCFVNPSLRMSQGWFEELRKEIESDVNIGIVAPCILEEKRDVIKSGWMELKAPPTGIEVTFPYDGKNIRAFQEAEESRDAHTLPLSCMFIRKTAVINIGVLDEGYGKYFADVDFCLRMAQSGFKVRYCGKSKVYDTEQAKDDTDFKSTMDYHRFRSKWGEQISVNSYGIIEFKTKITPINAEDVFVESSKTELPQKAEKSFAVIDDKIIFSIIIPVHNNLEYTRKCLDGIRKTKGLLKIEIIIINNGSSDRTQEFLRSLGNEIKVISNINNENYAYVNNQGAEVARGKYLVFLNNDTYPFPGWLDAFAKEFHVNPEVGIQGAKLLYENGTIQHAGMIFGSRPGRPEEPYHTYLTADPSLPFVNRRREFQFVTGACLVIRSELFRQVGGFDEEYVFGWEDTDLCMKVNTSGKKIIYNPEAVLYHYESGTKKFRQANGENMLEPDTPKEIRNRERFMSKWSHLIKRDAESFYAEDGLKMQGNTLVPISEEKFKAMMESQLKGNKLKEEKKEYFNSFSKIFLDRNYQNAKTVIIKSPPAIGDAFALTALTAELKEKYPQLKIYISGNEVVADIFMNHNAIEDIVLSGSEEELAIESMADVVVDYINIIAKLPEYYNGISYMDIFGNIAGMRFTKKDIIYTINEQEAEWARNEISEFKDGKPIVGIQLFTNKDQKRSYPFVKDLVKELLNRNPDFRFLLLGKESPGLNIPELYDCAWKNIPFRLQMALAKHCDKFLTIDSAFFHAGHNYFKKPTLVIFGLTNPALCGNPSAGFAVVRNNELNCLNCYWRIPCNIECMHKLTPSVIADEFMQIENRITKKFEYKTVTINVNQNTDIDELLFGFYINNKDTVRLRLIDEKNILPAYFENANGIEIVGSVAETISKTDDNLSGFNFELEDEDKQTEKKYLEEFTIHNSQFIIHNSKSKTSPQDNNGTAPQLNIVWEGSQFVYHSLALINREQCANIIDTGLANVTIVPYENDRFLPGGNPKYKKLKENDIRYKKEVSKDVAQLPYVWIRHQWPPSFEAPRGAKWIIMQPWEYTTLRKDFADLFKQADELWTPSTYSRQSFINSGIDFDKVQVIPNGIDPVLFKPAGDKYLIPTKKKLKFLYIGGTIFRKGIDVLLHAYTKAFNSEDDVTLFIKDMGGESFYKGQTAKDHIEKLSQLPGSPEIIYYDEYMTEEQIANLYRSCDVFVCSYRGEGFSLPTLEAMACGLPVIVTEGGSTDDFVDEKVGWLIPSQPRLIGSTIGNLELTGDAYVLEPDAEKLVEILKNVYSNPAMIFDKGLKGSYRARNQWTWRRSTLKIFSRLDYLYGTKMASDAENKLIDKRDAFIILGEADEQFDSGNYANANKLYSEALDEGLKPEKLKLHALHKLAMIEIIEGNFEQVEKYLASAEAISEGHPDSIYLHAKLSGMKQNWTEMLEQLTELMNKWKDVKFNTTLNVALDDLLCDTAEGFYEFGDIENSLNLYTEALKLNNGNPYACFGAARCFITSDIKEDAMKMLEWAVRLKPDYTEAKELLEELTINNKTKGF